jgi:hypothetical protein
MHEAGPLQIIMSHAWRINNCYMFQCFQFVTQRTPSYKFDFVDWICGIWCALFVSSFSLCTAIRLLFYDFMSWVHETSLRLLCILSVLTLCFDCHFPSKNQRKIWFYVQFTLKFTPRPGSEFIWKRGKKQWRQGRGSMSTTSQPWCCSLAVARDYAYLASRLPRNQSRLKHITAVQLKALK